MKSTCGTGTRLIYWLACWQILYRSKADWLSLYTEHTDNWIDSYTIYIVVSVIALSSSGLFKTLDNVEAGDVTWI